MSLQNVRLSRGQLLLRLGKDLSATKFFVIKNLAIFAESDKRTRAGTTFDV